MSQNGGNKFLTRSRESLNSARKSLVHLSTPKVKISQGAKKKLFPDGDEVKMMYSKANDKVEMVRTRSKEDMFETSDTESTVPMGRAREERVSLPPGPPPPPAPTNPTSLAPTPSTAPGASSSTAILQPSSNISSLEIASESVSLLSKPSKTSQSPVLLFSNFGPASEKQDVQDVEKIQDTLHISEDTSPRNHENLCTAPEPSPIPHSVETNAVTMVSDDDQEQESSSGFKTDDEIQKIFGSDSNTGEGEDDPTPSPSRGQENTESENMETSEQNPNPSTSKDQENTESAKNMETSEQNENNVRKGKYVNPRTSREAKRKSLNNKEDDKRTYRQIKKSFDGKVLTIHDKIDALHPGLGKEQDFLVLIK